MNLVFLLIIVLLILAIGGAPGWGYHNYGWGPSGLFGLILFVLIILILIRRF